MNDKYMYPIFQSAFSADCKKAILKNYEAQQQFGTFGDWNLSPLIFIASLLE